MNLFEDRSDELVAEILNKPTVLAKRAAERAYRKKRDAAKAARAEAYRKYQERVARTREERLAFDKAQAEKRDAESQQGSRTIVGGKDTSASATLKMVQGVPGIAKSAIKGIANIARKQALKNPKYAKFEKRVAAAGLSAAEREAEAKELAQQKIDRTASAITRLAKAREKNPNAFRAGQSSTTSQSREASTSSSTPSSGTTPTPQTGSRPSSTIPDPWSIKRRQVSRNANIRRANVREVKPFALPPAPKPKIAGLLPPVKEGYEYSCWREEFIMELRDLRKKRREKNEDAPVDKMRGTNKISLYPTVSNENVSYGHLIEDMNGASIFAKATPPLKKRTTPMSDIHLSKQPGKGSAERVEKLMRRLFLGDRNGFYANYDLSGHKSDDNDIEGNRYSSQTNEAYDEENETFRQHSRERFTAGSGDDEHQKRARRTARMLKRMAEMNKDVVPPKKKKKKKKKEGQV